TDMGPPADVFSLGVVLFQILTNQRCDRAEPSGIRAAQAGVLRSYPHSRRVPAALRRICEKATSPRPEDRYADAHVLARAIERWLEGAERRAQALELVEKADAVRPELARMRHKRTQLRTLAAQWLERVPPDRPVAEKRRAWAWEREADKEGVAIERTEHHYVELLTSALQQKPGLPEARMRLAAFYRDAHARAEQVGDRREAARLEASLYAFDDGTHSEWLRGDGSLTVVTEPAGARVQLYRYESHDRRRVPVPVPLPEEGPIIERSLAMGSYLLVLEAPDHQSVRYPVWLSRCHHWSGRPPGSDTPQAIVLPRQGSLTHDDCVVSAGWCMVGDGARRWGALARARVWVDGFVMKRFPVTNAAYLEFLQDLVGLGQERRALELAPRVSGRQGSRRGAIFERSPAGGFDSVAGADPLGPVVMIPHAAAEAYAHWYAQRTGLPWRLPGELEWEKAARGVDGRRFPWGDRFDPTHANCRETRPLVPELALVDTHPVDESPYGVRGLGGNVRDWCADVFLRNGPPMPRQRATVAAAHNRETTRVVRGGCWADNGEEGAMTTRRESIPADARAPWLGFRLVRSQSNSTL
ncbi:MAG TPA: protein kinase, partial [Deltaproteobacteria bacterium]|nr:protein kinase [Deltaproteobacteria bacterium]